MPSAGSSIDLPNAGSNLKSVVPIAANDDFALASVLLTPGVDSAVLVYDLRANTFRGQVVSTMPTNSNLSEPAWVGDVCYFVDGAGATIFMYDISAPDLPTETTFASSVTSARSIVASPDGTVLYVVGIGTTMAALDISSPLSPVETTLVITGGYRSLDIRPDGTALLMFRRASASDVAWTSITMSANGTDIAISTNDGIIAQATSVFDGLALIWPNGTTAICWASVPSSPINSQVGFVFDATNIDVVTLEEIFEYNHGVSGNAGPFRSLESAKGFFFFNGVTQQVTFGETVIEEPAPLTIDNPLRFGFGGMGLGRAFKGDLFYAGRNLPDDDRGNGELTRLGIGQPGQSVVVSGELPIWADPSAEFPDSRFRIFNVSDPTKEIEFDASGITTGNRRTLAAPDASGVVCLATGTPANNELAVWLDAATIEGEPNVRYTGSAFEIDDDLIVTNGDVEFNITTAQAQILRELGGATFLARAANDSSGIAAQFTGEKARGTLAAPTALINGSIIGLYSFKGHDGTAYRGVCRFDGVAREAYTGSARGAAFRYLTTPVGATTLLTAAWITSDGHIYIGANGTEPASGGGSLILQQGAALSGMASNTGAIQVKDISGTAEVFAVDEGGTATQLSAHPDDVEYDPSEPMPWAHRAEQPYLGKRVTCDMARAMRVVEELAQAAGIALPVDGLIHVEDTPVDDWHATSEARADRDVAAYEAWERTEQDHAAAVAKHERRLADEWEGLPSATDPVHDAWLALPEGQRGKRYRLHRAVDDAGRSVRVREHVEEPTSRVLRVRTREVERDDGRLVDIRERVEAPEPPEPLGTSLDLPMVKPPPRWIRERLVASGRWDQARHDAKVAEIEAWKTRRGL